MSELIDFVDADGQVVRTGVQRDDAEAYQDAYMQIIVGVITNSLGEILVHERANTKSVSKNSVDLVCGGIQSGETPEQAFAREAEEEVRVRPDKVRRVAQGINEYGRYRYLLYGESNQEPAEPDFTEVNWIGWRSPKELKDASVNGSLKFVEGFFEDLELVLGA